MGLQQIMLTYLDQAEISPGSKQRVRYSVNRWLRVTDKDHLQITAEDFLMFRKSCTERGLSPHSVEQTVYDIVVLLRFSGMEVTSGKPLRRPPPSPIVPELLAIGKAFEQAEKTRWPLVDHRSDWWRCFLALGLWTAFRLQDLLNIRWEHIHGNYLRYSPKKTLRHGLTQEIPLSKAVLSLIDKLPRQGERVLEATKAFKQFRRELSTLCASAGVEEFTPQDIRQAGITMWSVAHPEAGRIIHGCGKRDVMRHYLSPRRILEAAAPRCQLPPQMLPPDMRDEVIQQEEELVTRFRSAGPEQKDLMVRLSRQIG